MVGVLQNDLERKTWHQLEESFGFEKQNKNIWLTMSKKINDFFFRLGLY